MYRAFSVFDYNALLQYRRNKHFIESIQTSNEHILQHTLYTEIPYAEILWDTSNTNPFDQMVDRQNMPPVYLELLLFLIHELFLPPDPALDKNIIAYITIDNILPLMTFL